MKNNRSVLAGLFSFLVACHLILLSGCILKYEDVSEEPEYASLLNTCYSLKKDMLIYGVNLEPGYGKDINIYVVHPMSLKIGGPEIIVEDILPSGTIFQVHSIRRSINTVLFVGKKIQAVVGVSLYVKSANVLVVIDLKYIQSNNYMNKEECKKDNIGEK